jgi:acyl carrier protein
MSIGEKPRIMRWIYREEFPTGSLDFRDVLSRAAVEALGKTPADAEAYTEANVRSTWSFILRKQDTDVKRGLNPIFRILDSEAKRLAWCSPLAQSDRGQAVRCKRLRRRPHILRYIDLLTDRQYEALGIVVSELAGARSTLLTPKQSEGGIDFFASISHPSRCHVFSGENHPMRIIGQCKKFASALGDDRLKEFIQTIEDVKHQSPKVERFVPAWFRTSSGPVVGWIISHCGIQSGAETRSKNHGVLYSDSLDLAEIIALSRKFPISMPIDQLLSQLDVRIAEYLDGGSGSRPEPVSPGAADPVS